MKRLRIGTGALVMCMMFLLGGCGEKPIALTDQEEGIIVNYASHIVSKYNKRQYKGVVELPPETPEAAVPDTEADEPLTTEEPERKRGRQERPSDETDETAYVTLNDAVGLQGIEAAYTGAEVCDSYTTGDYFSLNAPAGRKYVVLYFNLHNPDAEAVTCDMLAVKPVFKALFNSSIQSTALQTILLNDFGTYQGTIEAGGTEEVVLLFEVDADSVPTVDSVILDIIKNETKLSTKL